VGGRPPADPDANLATLVSRLRAVLGPEVIAGDRHGWRFVAGPRVELDLDEATAARPRPTPACPPSRPWPWPPPSAPWPCSGGGRSWPTSPTPTGLCPPVARPSGSPPGPDAWPGTPPWPWETTPAPWPMPTPRPPSTPWTRRPGGPSCRPHRRRRARRRPGRLRAASPDPGRGARHRPRARDPGPPPGHPPRRPGQRTRRVGRRPGPARLGPAVARTRRSWGTLRGAARPGSRSADRAGRCGWPSRSLGAGASVPAAEPATDGARTLRRAGRRRLVRGAGGGAGRADWPPGRGGGGASRAMVLVAGEAGSGRPGWCRRRRGLARSDRRAGGAGPVL
jgi:hypothetical protein